ncbi:hypothetical protein A3C23_00305 [Candidatus Roizmanbacteria bacterium RIFCSPHIGHO2_02_FULL_37_13b]|uniref:PDZ domain-containing protein n=1 Tax=Candidatus Roizmanbacteria bacterium RIFCSPLOWO2_02_FULL_36_11 TaxID=1802071 RepID=A0A1F7JHR0_9BACT|nr:MAG: hypothetical protein A3C23_00305 [Candidatus Roizmanbacteria bacterium RIFCSPHIGHO2_02_FULL_37_13b]OGK55138.1 MAG: hypothetical protein A3H78_04110 [Candidatus Roizmanbacteria bacterium RIFCSPLOWO2_02_FULL_36_11]
MNKKDKEIKRPKLLTFIIILTILGGIIGIIRSVPIFSLYNAVKQGGITVSDKVTIQQVQSNTPAFESKLQKGDVILSVDGKIITDSSEFVEISDANQGKQITILISRNGRNQTIKLTPRVDHPANEGRIGIVLSNSSIEKKSLYKLVPLVIIRAYSGREERYSLFFGSQVYQDKELHRLKSLIFGIIWIIIGVALWNWKKWAIYICVISTAFSVLSSIPYLVNPANYQPYQSQSIFLAVYVAKANIPNIFDTIFVILELLIDLTFTFYIFRKRNLFK